MNPDTPTRLKSLPDPLTAGSLLRAFRKAAGLTVEEMSRIVSGKHWNETSVRVVECLEGEEVERYAAWVPGRMLTHFGCPYGTEEAISALKATDPDSPLYAALRHALAVACGVEEDPWGPDADEPTLEDAYRAGRKDQAAYRTPDCAAEIGVRKGYDRFLEEHR